MLRITSTGTDSEERWILCGQLAGPWVCELKSDWEKKVRETSGRKRIVDLSDVTFIDENGEILLRELKDGGAEFITNGGVATRDLIENLRAGGQPPVRRFLKRSDQ
jgi:hypothetical protein